jgi:integrase
LTADRLTTRELDLYVHKRAIKEGVKRATVSSELRLLKAVYSWAASQQPPLVHINPTAGFKVKTAGDEKDVPIPPTVDEIRRILNHAGPYLVRAIKIHWHSGIRPGGELQRLRWEHIDFINKEIRIYSAHKGGPVIRTVPISSALESDLKAWLEEDRLFKPSNPWNLPVVHLDGQSIKSLKRTWKTAKKRAGITRKMRLYDLRHAFASNALRAGADLKSVSELLGHSRPDTTLREYQHVTREQHRQAIELIPDVDRGPSGTILPMRNIKR